MPFRPACEAMAASRRVTPLRPAAPPLSAWGVQVGYGASKATARASYDRLAGRCRAEAPLDRLEFVPLERRGPGRRPIVAARIGAGSRAEAIRLCEAISDAGCICRAFRN